MSDSQPQPPSSHVSHGDEAVMCLLCGEHLTTTAGAGQQALMMHVRRLHEDALVKLPPIRDDILSFPTYVTVFSVPGIHAVVVSAAEAILGVRVAGPWATLGVFLGSVGASVLGVVQSRRRELQRRRLLAQMFPLGVTVSAHMHEGPR